MKRRAKSWRAGQDRNSLPGFPKMLDLGLTTMLFQLFPARCVVGFSPRSVIVVSRASFELHNGRDFLFPFYANQDDQT